jgi:aromatic-L-amino-acid decarboxylase
VCLRHVPPVLVGDEEALARHNAAVVERINSGGRFYYGTSILKGRLIQRVSVGAQPTERADVEAFWAALREAAAGV